MAEETAAPNAKKKAAHRSPNYPAFDLATALDKIRLVYDQEKRTATTRDVIAEHLGYKNTDGPGGRALSGIRQFAFLEDAADKLKVSDIAFSLLHLPDEDPSKAQLLKQVALRPNLYRSLHEDYPDSIPSDSTLRSNLLKRGFNPDSIDVVIADFKSTMELAKVYDVSDNGVEDESKMQTPPITLPIVTPVTPGGKPPLTCVDALPTKPYSYVFEGDGRAVLTITGTYTAEDLDDLEASIATTLKTLRRSVKKETVQ
jgi:hypothetical protein